MRGALLGFGVCLALLFGGCGGSDDSASTSSSTSQATPTTAPAQSKSAEVRAQAQGKSQQANKGSTAEPKSSQEQSNTAPNKHLNLAKVPPISSAPKAGSKHPAPGVKTVKGGDNSVQEYGVEADESERTEAAIALQGYLNARAQEDWPTACSLLAKRPMQQIEKIQSAAAKQGQDPGSCAATLALLRETQAEAIKQAQITEVLSFRGQGDLSGDPSYLIFVAPPSKTLYSMPMYLQGGSWKVGLARPSELPVG